jgi:hypothetical protein
MSEDAPDMLQPKLKQKNMIKKSFQKHWCSASLVRLAGRIYHQLQRQDQLTDTSFSGEGTL